MMIADKGKGSRTWLFWSGVLLLGVVVAVVFVGHLQPSQALTPVTAEGDTAARLGEGTGEMVAYTTPITYYAYLPAIYKMKPSILLQENFDADIGRWTPFLNYEQRLQEGQWYWRAGDGVGGSGALSFDSTAGPPGKVASDALMMYLQPGAEDWTNYRVEAKLYLTGGVTNQGVPEPNSGDPVGFWIRGHYQDAPKDSAQWVSGYYVVLCGKSDGQAHWIRIAKMQEPGDCDACNKPYRLYNFNNPLQKYQGPDIAGPFEHFRWYKLAVEVRGANIKVYVDDQLAGEWTDPTLPYLSGTIGFKAHETKTVSFDDVIVTSLP
jgi:hypothetical protein